MADVCGHEALTQSMHPSKSYQSLQLYLLNTWFTRYLIPYVVIFLLFFLSIVDKKVQPEFCSRIYFHCFQQVMVYIL